MRNLARLYRNAIYCVTLLVLVASASAQVPSQYFSALQWRLVGPFRGGRTIAAVGVPSQPNTFYFGSVDGGLFQSTNAGLTWNPIADGQPIASVGAIAVAPSDPDIMYLGTGETDIRSNLASGEGVYKSTDGGHTWHNVGLPDTRQISRIAIDPGNPDIVYVAALGYAYGPNEERGIFKSEDGGKTWKKVLFKDQQTGASDLALASGAPNVLFAGLWNTHRPPWSTYAPIDGPGAGLYRSTDSGATWTELKSGLPEGNWGRVGVSCSPDGRRVYALIVVNAPENATAAQRRQATQESGLYRSDDRGDSWKLANSDPRLTSRSWYFDWLTVDPTNPDIVYVPNVALYRTEDGGKTISIVRGAPGGDDYHDLWVDPRNSSHLILATDQGASVSLDRGLTWSSWYNQPTAQFYHLTTDDRFPYTIYGTQQDSGAIAVASRSDHGVISGQDWVNVAGGESGYLALDPHDPDIIYASGQYGGVTRYDRRTSLSQDVSPWPVPVWAIDPSQRKYRAPWTPILTFSPLDKKTLYYGTQYVMRTSDGGLHWQTISPDLTRAGQANTGINPKAEPTNDTATALGLGVVYAIAPSPIKAGLIWAGTDNGLVYVTSDNGQHWQNVTPKGVTDWSRVSMIEASRFDPGTAYVAVDRHRLNDLRPYIYRTHDGGKTWDLVVAGINDIAFARAVREDTAQKGLLFAGTERGPYFSADDGNHWQPLQLNLPATAVYDLVVHDNDLIAGTHGRSFWVLDDISPLRQSAEVQANTAAYLYAPAPAVRVDNDQFLGTPLPPEEPQAKNPPDGAIVDYYLRSEPNQVTLEVYNSANQLVRKYSSERQPSSKHAAVPVAERWFPAPRRLEKSAGMHRFVWDLRWFSSGEAVEDDEEQSPPPKGPRVVPGEYTIKLTAGGETVTQKLDVRMDPRASVTSAVLADQERLAREIYADTLQSRKAVSETTSVAKQLRAAKIQSEVVRSFLAELEKVTKDQAGEMGLDSANTALLAVLRVTETSDREIPSQVIDLYHQSRKAFENRAAEWQKLKTSELPKVNDELQRSGAKPIKMSAIEQEIQYLMTR